MGKGRRSGGDQGSNPKDSKKSKSTKNRRQGEPDTSEGKEPSIGEHLEPITTNQEHGAPVPPDNEPPETITPGKKYTRCPFFFGLYGCEFGDDCKYKHDIAPHATSDVSDIDNDLECYRRVMYFEESHWSLRRDIGPCSLTGIKSTGTLDVKSDSINRATEPCLKQIGKFISDELLMKIRKHGSDDSLKLVEIYGNLDQVGEAHKKICEFMERKSTYFRLLADASSEVMLESKLGVSDKQRRQKSCSEQSVFRMLLPAEVDIEAFVKEDKCSSLKLIKRKDQNVVLVYANQQRDCLSTAANYVLRIYNYVVEHYKDSEFGGKLSAKLLVGKEQVLDFFQTKADAIEKECNCTFAVYDTDEIGFRRDLILEIVGNDCVVGLALTKTLQFFENFTVHMSMIPVMEVLMEKRPADISRAPPRNKSKCIFVLELYYAAIALVGKSGEIIRKIQEDTNGVVNLEEEKHTPGKIMIYMIGSSRQVRSAEQMVKDHIIVALKKACETLIIRRTSDRDVN